MRHRQNNGWFTGSGRRRLWPSLLLLLVFWLVCPGQAAEPPEQQRAYQIALNLFKDGFWERAEKELAAFIQANPEFEKRPEAVLYQAQARFKQVNYAGVVELLQAEIGKAGVLSDEYRFWIAEAHFQSQQFAAAAAAYAQLLKDYPRSNRRLEASYGEAFCRFKLQEWNRVKELLGDPNGDFQQIISKRLNEEIPVRGLLLLGETLLLQKEYQAGEQALARIDPEKIKPELAWRRQYLLCRIQLADNRPQEALAGTAALLRFAEIVQQNPLLAESVSLQAGIYEQLNQPEAAVAAYERNLTDIASPEQRRQALLKVIQLTLAQNNVTGAVQRLEAFAVKNPKDPAQDLAQLTLGELKLRRYCEQAATNQVPAPPPPSETNLLSAALPHFERVISEFPQSQSAAKAYLNRGWCLWLMGNYEGSQPSFRMAADSLPVSLEQAVARFKLGDTYIWQKDYTNALAQFNRVVQDYGNLPRAKTELFDQALYQILRANIAIGDLPKAEEALQNILTWYPESYFSDRSMLVLGQALNRVDRPAKAREVFAEFTRRFPASALAAEAHLAMARTYVSEGLWSDAIAQYDLWAANEAARRALPHAEFDRAWVYYKAGRETNALSLFSRFVEEFPTNALAPQAKFWVASYYFRQADLTNAEAKFQLIFQNTNWPITELTWQARMMAGRAALARQSIKDATNYFLSLINDERCPTNLLLEACFALGDTLIETPAFDPAKDLEKFTNAIVILRKIPQISPTNQLVPAALGRIGDCYLQLASQSPAYYDNAAEHYQKAMTSTDVAIRSQAEVGLGLVFEKKAAIAPAAQQAPLLGQALDHYLNVVYGKNLAEGEIADPFWLKRAALAAAALKEAQQDYPTAINLYTRLKTCVPALGEFCDKKIKAAQDHLK